MTSVAERRDVLVQHDVEGRMRDGVVLRADVYRPADGGRYPVLLSRQPYSKDVNINLMYADPVRLAAHGYIVVMQDVRGRYASDGEFTPSDQEFEDGYDSVQWAAELPGSDGQVGMFGRSYHSETQWRAAVMEPPALRSMVTGVSRFHYSTEAQERPGGAHEGSRLGWMQFLIGADILARRHRGDPEGLARAMAEFGRTTARLASGELFRLLPLHQLAALPGSMMGDVIAAMSRPLDAALHRRPWPTDTYERVHADTFHVGGWYDIFTPGTLTQYEAMRDVAARTGRRVPHLLVGPWTHSSYLGNAGELDFGPAASGAVLDGRGGLNGEHLRWYDATLKGRDDALADTAPVRLFVMGENRWRSYDSYPVPGARTEDWYLQPGGGLERTAATDSEPDRYDYDPADPVPTRGGSTMLAPTLPPGPFDQREIEARPDVLSYTSAPLEQPYTVLGAVSVTLFAASSAPDTDFVARLVDVHPDGRAFNVVDGIIRASARDTYPEPGVVRPAPPSPLEPDAPYRFCIDLWATGLTFLPGHRIRVDVTSSSHPRWIRHTNTDDDPVDATETRVARQRIFHDPTRPSRIHVTVV
ncbi:CocE/NonD family hydrolase [Geodermatophilus sp. CPCC 205506]|uniref:CocE/NonD family hydrolase n=1 Tax=Geodermatophilus sp. CPCC 205506 TaxID=2936596 RepID=UPI003EE8DC45